MSIATHLVKVNGTFDPEKWTEKMLKSYVREKIKVKETIKFVTGFPSEGTNEIVENGIFITFHPDLELFRVEKNTIKVWVFITGFPSEVTDKIVEKWLSDNIKEDGLKVESFEIKEMAKLWDVGNKPKNFFVITS